MDIMVIIFIPIFFAMNILLFAVLYYILKSIKFFLIKFFNIDKKLLDKLHIISFVSINILISAFFLIRLLYKINIYGVDLTVFIDKDDQVYLGSVIFTFILILESIIISIICIFINNRNIPFKLFRNGF